MENIFRVERNARSSFSRLDSQESQAGGSNVLAGDSRFNQIGDRVNQMSAQLAAQSNTTRGRPSKYKVHVTEFADLFVPLSTLADSKQKGDLKTLFDYPALFKVVFEVALSQPVLIKDQTTDIFTDQICQLVGEHLDKVATFCLIRPNFLTRQIAPMQKWIMVLASTSQYRINRSKTQDYTKTFIMNVLKKVSNAFSVTLAGPVQTGKPLVLPKEISERIWQQLCEVDHPEVVDQTTIALLHHLHKIRLLARNGNPTDNLFQLIRCLEDYFATPDVLYRTLKEMGVRPKSLNSKERFEFHYDFSFALQGRLVDTTKLSDYTTPRPAIDGLTSKRPLLISGVLAHPKRARVGQAVDHNERLIYVNGRSINDYTVNTSAATQKVYKALLQELTPILVDGQRKTKRKQFVDFVQTSFFQPEGTELNSCALVSRELGLNIQADQQVSFDQLHVQTIDTIHNVGIQNLVMPLFAQLNMSVKDIQSNRLVVYSSGYCNVDYTLWGADICSTPSLPALNEDGRFQQRFVGALTPEQSLGYLNESLLKQVRFSPQKLTRKLINRLVDQYTAVIDAPSIPLHSLDEQTQMVLVTLALVMSDFVWHATPSCNHTAFMLFGESSTGKSTLCRFLKELLSLRVMTQDFVTARFQGPALVIGEHGLLADEQSLEAYMPTRKNIGGIPPFESLKSVLSIPSDGLTIQTKNKNNSQGGFPKGSFIVFAGNLPLEGYYKTLYNSYGLRGADMELPPIIPMLRKSTIVHTCWKITEGISLAYKLVPSQDDFEKKDSHCTLLVDKFVQVNSEQRYFDMLTKQLVELTFLYAHVRFAGGASLPDHERSEYTRRDITKALRVIATQVEKGQCMYKKLLLQDVHVCIANSIRQHVVSLQQILRETHLRQFEQNQTFCGLLQDIEGDWLARGFSSPYWSRQLVDFVHEMNKLVHFLPAMAGVQTTLQMGSPMRGFVSEGREDTSTQNTMSLETFVGQFILHSCEVHYVASCFKPLISEVSSLKTAIAPSTFVSRAYYNMRAVLGLFSLMYNYCETRHISGQRLSPPQIQSFALADFLNVFASTRVGKVKMSLFSMRCAALLALKRGYEGEHPAMTRISQFSLSDFVFLVASFSDLFNCLEKLIVSPEGQINFSAELKNVVTFCSSYICSSVSLPNFLTVYSLFRMVNLRDMTSEMLNTSASAYGTGKDSRIPQSTTDMRHSVWNVGTYFSCLLSVFFERKMLLLDALNGSSKLYGEIINAVEADILRQKIEAEGSMAPLDVTLLQNKVFSHQTKLSRQWQNEDDSALFVSRSFCKDSHIWWYDKAQVTNDVANRHVQIQHTVVNNQYQGLLSSTSQEHLYPEEDGLQTVFIPSMDMINVTSFRAPELEESKVGEKRTFSQRSQYSEYNQERYLYSYDREDYDQERDPSYYEGQQSINSLRRT